MGVPPIVAFVAAGVLLAGCGNGKSSNNGTTNGVISANPSSLMFTGSTPSAQTLSISYVSPPTQTILAGAPATAINPFCIGINPTCRLSLTLVSASNANPLVYSVTVVDTANSHSSTLRFVSTDLAYQTNFGYIDVTVTHAP